MNRRNLHIDLIEKYIDNTLDIDEVELFNKTLENDEEFVRDLNDMEGLIAGIKKAAASTTVEEKLERFNNSIKIMEEDEKPDTKTRIFDFENIKRFSGAIAASITILLVASITLFNINQTPTNQKLYTKYYSPLENYGNKRGPEKSEQNYWKVALAYYDEGMFDSALINFQKIQISDFKRSINDPSFPLYKGNTLMMLGKHDEAIVIFKGMLDDNDGMIMHARWYLSMCYLYENNTDKLVPLLEEIAEVEASAYSRDAQKILDQLR